MSQINQERLEQLLGQMVGDMGAAVNGALVLIGDRLGLYHTLATAGPMAPDDLARRAGVHPRYAREWLSAQAASGYVSYEPTSELFFMTPEQAAVLADDDSDVLMTGGFYAIGSVYHDEERLTEAYRRGEGLGWGDHHSCLFCGTEKFFRPGYQAHLVSEWLPAIDGLTQKLEAGARVADVGCGYGASTLIMAGAFPRSTFVGFDNHAGSIEHAAAHARDAGLDNLQFEKADAKSFPGAGYDLIAFFDCLHDMGDPVGALVHARNALADGGAVMLVEPFAGDRLEDNLNPVGRVYYGFSSTVCVPASMSQEVGLGLGAQAGEARLRQVAEDAGYSQFRRVAETPFNLILEARA